MREIFEEYGSTILAVIGAAVIIGIAAYFFLGDSGVAPFILSHLNAAF